MKPCVPLFISGIFFTIFTASLSADPKTGTTIEAQKEKLIEQLPAGALKILDKPYVEGTKPGSNLASVQTLDLYVPAGNGPFPLIIWIHGGGWHGGDKETSGASLALQFLPRGFALTIPWAATHVPVILEAWYPGEFGGRAIAETLFGDNNPAGRLPVSFPKRIGQLPVFYNHFPSKGNKYVDGDGSPQFVFGFGLSYTTFKYDHLTVTPPSSGGGDDILVSFDLKNPGNRDGDEVAQLYVHQTTASVATPVEELKGFYRVHLQPGETQHVTLHVKQTDLAIWGAKQEWKTEPGEYTVKVGGSSAANLSAKFKLNE